MPIVRSVAAFFFDAGMALIVTFWEDSKANIHIKNSVV